MPNSDYNHRHRGMVYSYERERMKKFVTYLLLLTSLLLFISTLLDLTEGISVWMESFLLNNLGHTGKWSDTYGPHWFVHTVNDISALAGKPLIFIALVLIVIYYKIREEHKLLWKFLLTVLGGIFVLQIMKMAFTNKVLYEPIEFIIENIAGYPSGHAMIAMIFYLTLAVFLTRKQRRHKVRIYTLISASVIIFLVGICRILGANHSFTEVLAGWSAGLAWLCICWLIERFVNKITNGKFIS